ncbi:MAG: hypothetical protein COX20_11765 [Desulfobacterales bacterium CG23_combo_of_CG06-09_8_20_14_all_52_9]|nr:MAG: hypothetical protein COX20_11765 [Desulfobacterales bacterium CG23_combo_of_CG06-09_8_20_14_all_52_9]
MENQTERNGVFKTFLLIAAMVILILGKGFLAYYLIGDLGTPPWDFRPVKDVPAESPYAIYDPLPNPQHIQGVGGN